MTPADAAKQAKKPLCDLITQYRPVGLKAVLAAALQAKAKPVKRPA
ncbi:hypothetical protein [Rhizobium sp. SG2393]